MSSTKKGFSAVETVIILVVLVVAGLIAWKVWETSNTPKLEHPIAPAQQEVQSKEDLDKVDRALDETNIEGDEAKQLDTEVNF